MQVQTPFLVAMERSRSKGLELNNLVKEDEIGIKEALLWIVVKGPLLNKFDWSYAGGTKGVVESLWDFLLV